MVLNYFQLNSCPQATATRNMHRQYEAVLSMLQRHCRDTKILSRAKLLITTARVRETAWLIHYFFIGKIRQLQQCNLKSGFVDISPKANNVCFLLYSMKLKIELM